MMETLLKRPAWCKRSMAVLMPGDMPKSSPLTMTRPELMQSNELSSIERLSISYELLAEGCEISALS